MSTISRPLKEGSTTTYVAKVLAGYEFILAAEVDADIDAMIAAWNAGADPVNIKALAVTTAKLAAAAVTAEKIADLAVTAAKLSAGAAAGNIDTGPASSIEGSKIKDQPDGITTGKINLGATVAAIQYVSEQNSGSITAEETLLTLPSMTLRGTRILLFAVIHASWARTTATTTNFIVRLKEDGVVLPTHGTVTRSFGASGGGSAPVSAIFLNEHTTTAGARVYTVTGEQTGAAGNTISGEGRNHLLAIELA